MKGSLPKIGSYKFTHLWVLHEETIYHNIIKKEINYCNL